MATLQVPQPFVVAANRKEFAVCAPLGNLSVLKHDNFVCVH